VLRRGEQLWSGTSARYSRPSRQDLSAALRALLASSPLARDVPSARVGLCVPGIIDEASGKITHSTNVPSLIDAQLDLLIRSALPVGFEMQHGPSVFSDAHAAAFDFAVTTQVQGRLLAISLGTGIGAAALDDGHLVILTGRSSGHFGQLDVTVPGIEPAPIGPDGGRGGLEAYLGAPALAARHGDIARWLASLRGDEPELAALARAIRIGHAIYRPQHIALLGGIGTRLSPILESLRDAVASSLTSLARLGWTLSCGRSDHHAACGAARLALNARVP